MHLITKNHPKHIYESVKCVFYYFYRSDERDKALQLCGWRFDKETLALDTFLDRLESEGAHTRAAAIAVFNLKLRMAVKILGRGGSQLLVVGFAMSGFPSKLVSIL